ncbi:hypothetical protein DEDE109153_08865 [Deinococcus deserti]
MKLDREETYLGYGCPHQVGQGAWLIVDVEQLHIRRTMHIHRKEIGVTLDHNLRLFCL